MGEFADYAVDEAINDYWPTQRSDYNSRPLLVPRGCNPEDNHYWPDDDDDDDGELEDEAEHIFEYRRKATRTFWYPGMRVSG